MPQRILVTGITGFLGGLLTKQLLEKGMHLRGTMNTLSVHNKGKIRKTFTSPNLEVAEFSLLNASDYKYLLKDIDTVVHLAFPRIHKWRTGSNKELKANLIEGTSAFYKSCIDNGVQRFINASFYSTAINPLKDSNQFDSNDWNPSKHPQISTKVGIEKELWNIYQSNTHKTQLTLLDLGVVFGHCIYSESTLALTLLVSIITDGKAANIPMGILGKEDAINVLCGCIENPNTSGKRYIVAEQCLLLSELGNLVSKIVHERGSKDLSYECMSPLKVHIHDLLRRTNYYSRIQNRHISLDTSPIRSDLNMQFNTVHRNIESLLDFLITQVKI